MTNDERPTRPEIIDDGSGTDPADLAPTEPTASIDTVPVAPDSATIPAAAHERSPRIDAIFRSPDTKHGLTEFTLDEIEWLEERLIERDAKFYVECLASDRERPAKPEEIVRQLWIRKLMTHYHYAKDRIQVERPVWFGSGVHDKAADIVVLHNDGETPYIIFEVKKPKRQDGLQQLKSYCNAEGSPIGVWSNGTPKIILHRENPNVFSQISTIPTAGQSLEEVLREPWTLERLAAENRLVREHLSLKRIILDLEDLVLANAGVDAFEEVFKLLYAKLYDEWAAANLPDRGGTLQFRRYGESPTDLKTKINGLLHEAKRKWADVFAASDKIELTPAHLITCVTFLQDIKLFNANLQVIDEAFEYLVTQVAKGSKGQYFTPRWAIDMSIKMLNPQPGEYVIDPAAGSCGFLVHSIMWVAGDDLSTDGLPEHARDFAQNNVYAIDFDGKAIKIAKAMNLIAGDGKTHVFRANSLDPPRWEAAVKAAFNAFAIDPDAPEDEKLQALGFDVLLTNPPFAGQIRERDILRQYRIAERNGRTVPRMSRDVLFVERCLRLLRPGGRMAIVLPQGRLNNTTDLPVRRYVLDHARILAVVGLHPYMFRPHTGTKTSILFLQKLTDDELATISETRERHQADLHDHLESLSGILDRGEISADDIPEPAAGYLEAEFIQAADEEDEDADDGANPPDEPDADIRTQLTELLAQLAAMPARARGKTELKRSIYALERHIAGESPAGRLRWLLDDPTMSVDYGNLWLAQRVAEDLDEPIFFAVSTRPGKDSGGNPVLLRGIDGQPIVDEHGHLVIDHDLDEIAESFRAFARESGLEFAP